MARHRFGAARALATAALVMGVVCARPSLASAQAPADHQDHAPDSSRDLVIRAFGSVDWGATDERDVPNSFTLGQFALFVTSTLSERISVLAEVVMEGSTNTRVITDLERLQVTFRFNDHLQVSAGRYHTGIGFYNAAFHHGSYFETPIGRPRVFAFEDEGGVLPVHEVGLTVRGVVPKTGSSLHYLAEVGNGRTWGGALEGEEAARDQNNGKSTNIGVSYRPEGVRGFEIGTSYYRDAIPRPDLPSVPHRIVAAYVVYRTPSAEVMAEWLALDHHARDGVRHGNHAGYAQASKAWGKLRPYYRYDRLAIDPATPFIGPAGSYAAHIVGLRLDPAEWVGLKTQYERADKAGQRGVDSLRTQLVFVF